MDHRARAYHIQMAPVAAAAVAAAAVAAVHDTEQDNPEIDLTTVVLMNPDVLQNAGLSEADDGTLPLPSYGRSLRGHGNGVPQIGVDGGERDLKCPECKKVFLSDKAMYGHLRCHPERRYKGAIRPATADNVYSDGYKKPRRVLRLEAELPVKSPVTGKRGRPASSARTGGNASVPAQRYILTEEEAAMTLVAMASGRWIGSPELAQPMQPAYSPTCSWRLCIGCQASNALCHQTMTPTPSRCTTCRKSSGLLYQIMSLAPTRGNDVGS
ncbi:hypothetical protein GUJ93_ZPchr0004g39037 [Zizania palustris]|uniref:C2H2-type domain-containing protein n=1 Tax=Zizania palustris TaxID=103762 RepID=A0A8J5S5Q1_ZIZPA|nr:hypothetical protein GUJ93_ZPchr0004g39037 [Zizania palustris]